MKNVYLLLFGLLISFVSTAQIGPITGITTVCVGDTATLSDTTAGGTWSTDNSNATIDEFTGLLTGVTAGTTTVSYTIGGNFELTIVTINPLPDAGGISGTNILCAAQTATFTPTVPGGMWSTANGHTTVSGGIVTGISEGIDTIFYSVANSCGMTAAAHAVTVNPAPDAGTISGFTTVCESSTIGLTSTIPGGTWSAANANASVSGGLTTGVTAGMDTIIYTVSNSCGTATATFELTVDPLPVSGFISGPISVCPGGSVTLTASEGGGVWSASNTHAAISSGIVTGADPGIDTIAYTVTNSCGSSAAIYVMTVNPAPDAGSISGPAVVCEGAAIILTNTATGGVWSAELGNATVTDGTVTGVTAGTDVISYTVTNACGTVAATHEITVNVSPVAPPISGPTEVCTAASITLTNPATGGIWSISNGHATISGGIVTGVSAGTDTVTYSISNGCGTATATYEITVKPLPDAGSISGPSLVCIGATAITLTNSATGGAWSVTNGKASITGSSVTGISAGVDTVLYTVTNTCGTHIASHIVTVSAMPSAGGISGASSVCQGASMTMTNGVTGGVWSTSNGNATVTDGLVIGVSPGTVTISYTVSNSCGIAVTSKNVIVNPLPNTGTITGPSSVCPGSAITLESSVTGGFWHASNGNATVSTSGVVTGVTAGATVISYSLINSCGTASAIAIVIVNPLPDAGTISGAASLCVAATMSLTPSVSGGTWSAANSNATITALGLVHAASAGADTFSYSVTNSCGTAISTHVMTINPLPVAGTISGTTTVCVLAATTLTTSGTGGEWSASNTNATVTSGEVMGVTAGTVVITYSVTNVCGASTATRLITVNPQPVAGTISGTDVICETASTTLTDPAPGGVWSASNSHATVTGGIVTGASAGTVTISYTVTNACGVEGTSLDVTVNPMPVPGTITGAGSVCAGSSITLSDTATGGSWSLSNTLATISGGVLTAIAPGTINVSYTVSNSCGTLAAVKTVTINPIPNAGTIAGESIVCAGDTIVLTDVAPGGIWSHDNGNATVVAGIVTGINPGTVTISYTITNACGTSTTTVSILVQSCGLKVSGVDANTGPQIFPNPASDLLNILTKAGSYRSLVITNSVGSVVAQRNLNNEGNIAMNIQHLTPGTYYIKLQGDKEMTVKQFVKL